MGQVALGAWGARATKVRAAQVGGQLHQQAQGQALFVQASEGAAVWILVEALEQGGDGAATRQLGKARAVALQPRQRPQGAIAGFSSSSR